MSKPRIEKNNNIESSKKTFIETSRICGIQWGWGLYYIDSSLPDD